MEIVLLTILGFCVLSMLIIAVSCLIYFLIDKLDYLREDRAYNKLHKFILEFMKRSEIALYYKDKFDESHNNAAAYISCIRLKKNDQLESIKIYMLNASRKHRSLELALLYHEVGHYISMNCYKDDSEDGANIEGLRLIKRVLTEKELNCTGIKILAEVYFESERLSSAVHSISLDFFNNYEQRVSECCKLIDDIKETL